MDLPLIPPELEKWHITILNNLIKLRDVESETFDFKGTDFKELYKHICAFVNYPISGIIVLGVEEDKPADVIIGFKKNGFDFNKEDWVRNEINNQMANVEPIPKVSVKQLPDNDTNDLFPVLKIEGEEVHRPYFVKGSGQCYVRIGASTSPASRTTALNLFSNMIAKRTDVERLRSAAGFLKEALTFTCKNIRDVRPTALGKIPHIDLTYIKNAALSTEWFLIQNDLLGGHHNIDSFTGGFYSFLHDVERLNLLINTYNTSLNAEWKRGIKEDSMQFWEPGRDEYNKAVGF